MKRLRFSPLVLCFVLSFPLVAAEKNVSAVVEEFEGMTVGAPVAVSGQKVSTGHMVFNLASGSAAPVVVAGKPVGFFFSGNGSYEYTSTDATEFPIVRFNTKKATGLKLNETPKAISITDNFTELLFIGEAPALAGAAGANLSEKFNQHVEYFGRQASGPSSHLFALKTLNPSAGKLTIAEMRGGKEPATYLFDDVSTHNEGLYALRSPETTDKDYRKMLFRTTVSEQVIGGEWKKRQVPANFLLTDVDYTLIASDKKDATLTVTETIVPQNTEQRAFRFDLYSTYYVGGGHEPRHYNVKSIKDSQGRDVSFHHESGELVVSLPAAVAAGQEAKLTFEIDGDFLYRPGGDSYWELGVEPWFPQPQLGEQYYTVHSVVKVKQPFIPFAPGKTIRREKEGEYNVLETRIEQPVQFAVVLAGKYHYEEETRNGLTIRVASYGQKNPRAIKQLTDLAFGVIDNMQWFLGPFPFSELNILEKNEYGYGQAPPGTMFITQEAFNPLADTLNQIFSQGVNERFAHEIAHQYWGHVVKMPSGEEQWLTESFAEYSAALFLKKWKGQKTYDQLVRTWKSNAAGATEASPIPLANRIQVPGDPMIGFMKRTHLVYDKGAYLLAHLHKEVGDQQFLSFLKSYQKSFRFKFGTTEHVEGLLNAMTKKDYSEFFNANFWGTGMPK